MQIQIDGGDDAIFLFARSSDEVLQSFCHLGQAALGSLVSGRSRALHVIYEPRGFAWRVLPPKMHSIGDSVNWNIND